jgi:hypothetical protein
MFPFEKILEKVFWTHTYDYLKVELSMNLQWKRSLIHLQLNKTYHCKHLKSNTMRNKTKQNNVRYSAPLVRKSFSWFLHKYLGYYQAKNEVCNGTNMAPKNYQPICELILNSMVFYRPCYFKIVNEDWLFQHPTTSTPGERRKSGENVSQHLVIYLSFILSGKSLGPKLLDYSHFTSSIIQKIPSWKHICLTKLTLLD